MLRLYIYIYKTRVCPAIAREELKKFSAGVSNAPYNIVIEINNKQTRFILILKNVMKLIF